jgi:phosphoribosylformylglycinamidine synthase
MGTSCFAPGTVIISAAGEVNDIRKVVSPALVSGTDSSIYYIDAALDGFHLGGSSFAQLLNRVGMHCPTVQDPAYLAEGIRNGPGTDTCQT